MKRLGFELSSQAISKTSTSATWQVLEKRKSSIIIIIIIQLCCSVIHFQICLFEHLAQRNRQKSMKRTQTIKITDHKQKFHFPAKFLVCVVNMKLKVCRQGGETVQWLKHLRCKHKDKSSPPDPVRARAHCLAHAPTVPRVRHPAPPTSRAPALLCRARAPAPGSRAWLRHAAPLTGACALTLGLGARSAAVSALPGTRAFPPQPPPWSTRAPTRNRARSYQNPDRVGTRVASGSQAVAAWWPGGIRRSASEGYSAAFRAENALPRRPTLERTFL